METRVLTAALVGVCLCAVFVLAGMVQSKASHNISSASLTRYVSQPLITRLAQVSLKGDAGEALETLLSEANYHAAFAVGDDGAFGWSDNYASAREADLGAIRYCKRSGENCRVIVRIAPSEQKLIEDIPLSYTSAKAAERYIERPGVKAFAVSGTGAWGMAWNHKTKRSASKMALENCVTRAPDILPSGATGDPCRVIWLN